MREPLLGCAVGQKGIGKTYVTLQIVKEYVTGFQGKVKPRRVLILDVNDEFTMVKGIHYRDVKKFCVHPKIEARRLRPYNDGGKRMTLREISDLLMQVLYDFRGGLLLVEDVNKYVSDYMPQDLVGAICTNRHSDTDIILHFQSIGRVTTKLWQNINYMRFHKNTDSVDRHRKKFEDKYEIMKLTEIMVNQQYFNGNKRFYLTVDIDNMKIQGSFNEAMFNKALNEYISTEYNKVVKPYLKQTHLGKKKYTAEQATVQAKRVIKKMYFRK